MKTGVMCIQIFRFFIIKTLETHYYTEIDTPLGKMMAIGSETQLYQLEFLDTEPENYLPKLAAVGQFNLSPQPCAMLADVRKQVEAYFDHELQRFNVETGPSGTPFQREVWEKVKEIPFGRTKTYAGVAKGLGDEQKVRAVANANGANRVALIVPCHRVVGANQDLTGYRWGLERKEALLDHERRQKRLF
jgi:AraC family transcriptional regulator of adaptative response/methylated-DNA-[protein]-cysteine methyltransferase